MVRQMTEWPSKRGPITKIMPSDEVRARQVDIRQLGAAEVAPWAVYLTVTEARFRALVRAPRVIDLGQGAAGARALGCEQQRTRGDGKIRRETVRQAGQAKHRLECAPQRQAVISIRA